MADAWQDGTDDECVVVRALVNAMAHDSSADVRLAALAAIAAGKTTLPHILLKTRDVKVMH